jgi:hypothetical protein
MRIQCYEIKLAIIVLCLCFQSFVSAENMNRGSDQDKGKVMLGGRELGDLVEIQRLISMGMLEEALKKCNKILLEYPQSKYVQLEKINIFNRMKEPSKAQEVLDNLLKKYPDFEVAYLEQARLFLDMPMPEKGDHPLVLWLKSTDRRKSNAALEAIRITIEERRFLSAKSRKQNPGENAEPSGKQLK